MKQIYSDSEVSVGDFIYSVGSTLDTITDIDLVTKITDRLHTISIYSSDRTWQGRKEEWAKDIITSYSYKGYFKYFIVTKEEAELLATLIGKENEALD